MAEALSFRGNFGHPPAATASAHGRVNLIGEHTDYCDGFVLPTLIRPKVMVSLSLHSDGVIKGISDGFPAAEVPLAPTDSQSWLCFAQGAVHLLNAGGAQIKGANIAVSSEIPAGAGVSSSAALELALLRAFIACTGQEFSDTELALMGQKIEHDFVGTQCGIMDQMAVAKASWGEALFLDCRSHETHLVQLPADAYLAVIHSGSKRSLSSSLYNQRLAETKQAAMDMGVVSLREASIGQLALISEPVIQQRARHVLSENERVLAAKEALSAGDLAELGDLMLASHRSLQTDYEVSSAVLDQLVDSAMAAGALGARLTGAGFGGCMIALLPKSGAEDAIAAILADNPAAWLVDAITG